MAKIKSFRITNFKGAKDVFIDIATRQHIPVITLLGLNESGKTTILEAISRFATEDEPTKQLFESTRSNSTFYHLIPKHKEAAFTGRIEITASVEIDDDDRESAAKCLTLSREGTFDTSKIKDELEITTRYTYKDSDFVESRNYWTGVDLFIKVKGKRKFTEYNRPDNPTETPDYWVKVINDISSRLPKISYFPSFLVGVPDRIYLKRHEDETTLNKYYRSVLQDVLTSLNEGLSLNTHVVKRVDEYKNENQIEAWISAFLGGDKRKQIDAVFAKISSAISKEVIGNWAQIFQRPTSAKAVVVEWGIDTEKKDIPYATIRISDGETKYDVSQRSLGFRWFFSFLLFTRFRRGRDQSTIFLFDEPAANLHAKAQAELLSSFSKIVADGNQIIYSTHSHHMIEPRWLDGAYIVENLSIDFDDASKSDYFSTKPTEIKATKYKNFLSQSADRSSYYLPAIEKLNYIVPTVAVRDNVVVLEGVSDYHLFNYVNNKIGKSSINFIPGVGSSNMGPLLSYLIGLGSNFIFVLDDDKAGRLEKNRYESNWIIQKGTIQTLGDISEKHKGKKLENILSEETISKIRDNLSIKKKPTKKQIALYLSEAASTLNDDAISKETEIEVSKIINLMEMKIDNL